MAQRCLCKGGGGPGGRLPNCFVLPLPGPKVCCAAACSARGCGSGQTTAAATATAVEAAACCFAATESPLVAGGVPGARLAALAAAFVTPALTAGSVGSSFNGAGSAGVFFV